VASDLEKRIHLQPRMLGFIGAGAALLLALACFSQTRTWRNDATMFRRALEENPRNAAVRNNLAYYLMVHGRWAEAREELERAVADDPMLRPAQVNLADCYEELGDLPRAEEYWKKAEAIAPDLEIEANLERVRHEIIEKERQRSMEGGAVPGKAQ
jgi:Tfp pilus assembly protein PilF